MGRLADAIAQEQRADLGRALATRVAETVETSGLLPMFVTGDPDVAGWAASLGFPSIPDSGEGLNAAAAAGADWAMHSRSRWLVVHSDLPMLGVDDLTALEEPSQQGMDVIAPSADGGTSAIGSEHQIEFAFGPGSFHKHMARLRAPRVIATTGLLHDIDHPPDLESALNHPLGRWLGEVIG